MTGPDPETGPEPDRPEPEAEADAEAGRGAEPGLDGGPEHVPEPDGGPPRGPAHDNGPGDAPANGTEPGPEAGRGAGTAGAEAADAEAAAGRLPTGPPHPRSGTLGQTLKRTAAEFKEDGLTDVAAALTYYAVLSVFPALIALVSLVSLVMSREKIVDTLNDLVDTIGPASAAETFKKPIESMASSGSGTPSVLLAVGVLGALWTASGYVGAFVRASNVIYEVQEGRPFRTLRPVQLLVTAAAVLLMAVVLVGLVVSGPVAERTGKALGVGHAAVTAWEWAKWPVLVLVVVVIVAGLYYAAPNVRLPGPSAVLPGAVLALGVWLVASAGFAFYAANFGSYNETYGTLGGVVVFLVWLWLTNLAVVLGAEFNAERERGRQLAAGVPGAERRIQLAERSAAARKKRARTV
ncbi:YihY/virulence factor BrkB family protein [Streptomyces qinglanensis]|uniref:YihY/virulence factor BrkB family protein n=1 Tax=Streptomyces qinglanensis TaxID=943816 RepID=UPI0037AB839F